MTKMAVFFEGCICGQVKNGLPLRSETPVPRLKERGEFKP